MGSEATEASRPSSNGPLFSVVIPVFDTAAELARCLASLASQTERDFEVVVIDDGSNDDPRRIVEEFADIGITYRRQPHRGASAARNAGIEVSSGDYLVFLDADDEATPGWLEALGTHVRDSQAAIICCGMRFVSAGNAEWTKRPKQLGHAFHDYVGLFLPGSYAVVAEVLDAVGGFARGASYGEHSELALRLTSWCSETGASIEAIDEVLLIKHHDRSPETVARYDRARYDGALYKLTQHETQLRRDPKLIANYHAVAGVAAARLGDLTEARRHFRAAFQASPRPKHLARFLVSGVPLLADRVWMR